MSGRPPLTTTYRLQFGPDLGFDDACRLVPHLKRIGVSHLYASPVTTARAGSTHGYDVVDATEVSPALGGYDGLARLAEALHGEGMGLVVDIVPNHMAADPANAAWIETLELGRRAPRAAWFDIDWTARRVALPWLEDDLDTCLGEGKVHLRLDAAAARLLVVHHDQALPLRPATAGAIFAAAAQRAGDGEVEAAARAWAAIERDGIGAAAIGAARARLADALAASEGVLPLLGGLDEKAARPSPELARSLAGILGVQHWELLSWRAREERMGYRRFFEIDGLVGVRVEDPAVFDAVHALPIALVREGIVDGLRIDHVDGLADPAGYCETLRSAVGERVTLHVEKILTGEETLRPWPVDGTTGYEAMNWINGLFVDHAGWQRLRGEARRADPDLGDPARLVRIKQALLHGPFAPDLARLVHEADTALAGGAEPLATAEVAGAVAGLAAAFPVYRSYLGHADAPEDVTLVQEAADAATAHGLAGPAAIAAVHALILADADGAAARFRSSFQQLTGALMAKGHEDTELYRDVAFAAACEVGGRADAPALAADDFHFRVAARGRDWPLALTPLSTHDSKHSGDVRARLDVLAERAETWLAAIARWRTLTTHLKLAMPSGPAPDALDELTLYQGLVGAAPITAERLCAFLVKSMREAKRRTTWTQPNEVYETAVTRFARALIEDPRGAGFRDDLALFLAPIVRAGRVNALAQLVLQMTIPGVPDIFQGGETWDLSLVDPDNRRPVDWDRLVDAPLDGPPPDVRDDAAGAAKLFATARLARLRRAEPELFLGGDYRPLAVAGGTPLVAFARTTPDRALVVMVPVRGAAACRAGALLDVRVELPAGLAGRYTDVLGEAVWPLAAGDIAVAPLLPAGRPVAVLMRGGERDAR